MENEAWIKEIRKDIEKLDKRARDLEAWLIDNIDDPKYFSRKSEYDDVLFRLAQKRMKIESIRTGYRPPDTFNISSAVRIKR